ncbi:MAG: hemerythrin domain-containing protein [Wenzhouxiangella sp.]|jgi:hemerythrin-like domain-containing protein|nr:hemerythrin domain-containing protein [Wenzhouxiangella sp.]
MSSRRESINPGADFMQALRRDHAGLSRVLREIDTQAALLVREPARARPVLVDALRYLLRYHHAFHHPREDRLFSRIRAREASLEDSLEQLSDEHEVGEQQLGKLAEDLDRAPVGELRGKTGELLAERIEDYVRHTRVHMRSEETVFYGRAERVLDDQDWEAVVAADDGRQDPMVDLVEMGNEYPNLAEQLGLPVRHLGLAERTGPLSDELRAQMLALTDLYGGLAYEALELGRGNLGRLLAVRGPSSLVRAVGEISSANLRFAGQCVTRPPRWAINSTAALVVASLKPYLKRDD